ncbi:hypothetical protein UlMin_041620 [Ulmus minor]
MSRRGIAEEKTAKSDPIYCNRLVNMLVNHILKHGKKIIGLSNYLSTICGVTPDIAVKARRVGRSTHQVPIEIGSTQGKSLSIHCFELVDDAKGSGDAICKKEETHIMAVANRAFAHLC